MLNSSISSNSIQHKRTVQLFFTHKLDLITCYYSEPECTLERWQQRGTQHSQTLQHYIRLFSVICRTLVGGVLPLCRNAVDIFYWKDKVSKPFPKVNVITRLEFELTQYDAVEQHVNSYARERSTQKRDKIKRKLNRREKDLWWEEIGS